jgi:hypothetical protein
MTALSLPWVQPTHLLDLIRETSRVFVGSRIQIPVWRLLGAAIGAIGGPPFFSSAEIGDVDEDIVVVDFDHSIMSPTNDYVSGVTIKVNTISQVIVSGVRQTNQRFVHYTLAALLEPNDVVTWEYNSGPGNITDFCDNDLANVAAQDVTNNIGTGLQYQMESNSAHVPVLI